MSVFGGDSWAREAQHRKRRLDDLLLSSSHSYKKLSNGKYACLVCPSNPLLDSPLMVSMHNKGSRHIAAETRLKERELSRQEELNKRIALSADVSSSGISIQKAKHLEVRNKPLIEQTRKAILEARCNRPHKLNAVDGRHITEPNNANSRLYDSNFVPISSHTMELSQNIDGHNNSEKLSTGATEAAGKVLADWHAELVRRQERELKFTAAGWKRDCHGKWYKDENVEFDSDEEDPNDFLN